MIRTVVFDTKTDDLLRGQRFPPGYGIDDITHQRHASRKGVAGQTALSLMQINA